MKHLTIALAMLVSMPLFSKEMHEGLSIRDLLASHDIPAMRQEGGLLTLDLQNKGITSLEGLQDIPNIQNVQRLNLNSNRLTSVPADSIRGLNQLQELLLSDNQLREIDIMALRQLRSLRSLFVSNNPPLGIETVINLQTRLPGVTVVSY